MRDRLLIAILVDTGARITEVCSIKRENVNLEDTQIKVMGKGKKQDNPNFSSYGSYA